MQKSALISRITGLPHNDLLMLMQMANAVLAGNQRAAFDLLVNDGWEETDAPDGALMLDDGRPVSWISGIALTLSRDAFERRVTDAIDVSTRAQQNTASASEQQATCTILIDGQLCGGSLLAAPVCPKCALGKQGVAQIMTCDVCGAQTAVMR